MQFVFKINNVDYTSYVKQKGFGWSRNDIDAAGSGRDKTGKMRRKRVATKAKLKFSVRQITNSQMRALNAALYPETINVTYLDGRVGQRTAEFYCSSFDAGVEVAFNGETYWSGGSFNLIEV